MVSALPVHAANGSGCTTMRRHAERARARRRGQRQPEHPEGVGDRKRAGAGRRRLHKPKLAGPLLRGPLVHLAAPRAPEFVPWLFEVCERERIDVVMSGSELVLEALAPEADELRRRTGSVCIVSSPEVLGIGRDKLRTCRWLEASSLPVPGYADLGDPEAVTKLVERCGFPLIAKPRFGKGSDGVLTVRDEQDLERVVSAEDLSLRELVGGRIAASDLVLQEHLGHEHVEYTAGCFCDAAGELRGTIVLRRTLQAGTTVTAELGRFPEVRDTAGAIASALRPWGLATFSSACTMDELCRSTSILVSQAPPRCARDGIQRGRRRPASLRARRAGARAS